MFGMAHGRHMGNGGEAMTDTMAAQIGQAVGVAQAHLQQFGVSVRGGGLLPDSLLGAAGRILGSNAEGTGGAAGGAGKADTTVMDEPCVGPIVTLSDVNQQVSVEVGGSMIVPGWSSHFSPRR